MTLAPRSRSKISKKCALWVAIWKGPQKVTENVWKTEKSVGWKLENTTTDSRKIGKIAKKNLWKIKDGSHNWGGFAHIDSLDVYCLGAHFLNIWDPSFGKIQKDIRSKHFYAAFNSHSYGMSCRLPWMEKLDIEINAPDLNIWTEIHPTFCHWILYRSTNYAKIWHWCHLDTAWFLLD